MPARLAVKVIPGATHSRIAGWLGDKLKIRVSAPPEKGKANKQVQSLLADTLGLNDKQVRIVSGLTSSYKLIEFDGINSAVLEKSLGKPGDR